MPTAAPADKHGVRTLDGTPAAIHIQTMSSHIAIAESLRLASAASESVVLATVVRVVGSSYGGVGTRMVIRIDGSTVGLVSGGCLESDLCAHALEVHATGIARMVTYDTRADDDAIWGLGLGCNGLIDVLLQPLTPDRATASADMLGAALCAEARTVIATVVRSSEEAGAPEVGAQALFVGAEEMTVGGWGDGTALSASAARIDDTLAAGRRGLFHEVRDTQIALEVIIPAIRLVICGSGPDAVPLARIAREQGWDVSVVDHRPTNESHAARFSGARAIECGEAISLGGAVALSSRTAAVVMSHHFARDIDYVKALLDAGVAYVGVLGPRARSERMLAELAARGDAVADTATLYGPVGLDLGGEGPEAIALAVVAEISAVMNNRAPRHLRDRQAPMRDDASRDSPPTRADSLGRRSST